MNDSECGIAFMDAVPFFFVNFQVYIVFSKEKLYN